MSGTGKSDRLSLMEHIDAFRSAAVAVVGDIILDEYVWGDVSRISPEAPVPVVDVKNQTIMLGGAANVVNNMVSLGARPILCGVVGEDEEGRAILERLGEIGITTEGIVSEPGRVTTKKTRIVAQNQQVVRYDREVRSRIGEASRRAILKAVKKRLSGLDAIVVSDYGKGVVTPDLMAELISLAVGKKIPIAVDPKPPNFPFYKGVSVITPNHYEAAAFCGFTITDEDGLVRAGRKMLRDLKCSAVLVTQGREGMTLFEKRGRVTHVPTVAKKVFDVTGAGDTAIAVFGLGLAGRLDLRSAAIISNFAAGIVVGEVGTTTVKSDELKKAISASLSEL